MSIRSDCITKIGDGGGEFLETEYYKAPDPYWTRTDVQHLIIRVTRGKVIEVFGGYLSMPDSRACSRLAKKYVSAEQIQSGQGLFFMSFFSSQETCDLKRHEKLIIKMNELKGEN